MKRMILMLFTLVAVACSQVTIPKNSKVQVLWDPPADSDVVAYRLYYTQTVTDSITINEWYTSSTDTIKCNSIFEIPLAVGNGYVELSAIDLAGNVSDRSNKVYFTVVDPKPGAPFIIELKVL
jgi:hypothetical protein